MLHNKSLHLTDSWPRLKRGSAAFRPFGSKAARAAGRRPLIC